MKLSIPHIAAWTAAIASLATSASFPYNQRGEKKPAAFYLAGDSTTAVQSSGGGGKSHTRLWPYVFNTGPVKKLTNSGWGTGFLKTLTNGANGSNFGHDGATTVSFVVGGDWARVIDAVKKSLSAYTPYVTIQVFANTFSLDQVLVNHFPVRP